MTFPIAREFLQAESDRLAPDHYALTDKNCDGCDRLAAVSAEFAALSERPQIYVYLTSGGILEYEITRGNIDVISIDWDNFREADLDTVREARDQIAQIADEALRKSELEDIDEIIADLEAEETDRAEDIARARAERIESARAVLREAGEL